MNEKINILGIDVNCENMNSSIHKIFRKINTSKANYICVTGAHGIVESLKDKILKNSYENSFLNVPDGMPCVWIGRMQGNRNMKRVYGPDLMINLIKESETTGHTHFFYGADENTLKKLKNNLLTKFPKLKIVGCFSPPFRALKNNEEIDFKNLISELSPDFMWIGLSCPKQEKYMFEHSFGKPYELNVKMMIGVGAAFDFHANNIKDAPDWVKNSGLQWLHRLIIEPRRLWKRYFYVVPKFIIFTFLQKMRLIKF